MSLTSRTSTQSSHLLAIVIGTTIALIVGLGFLVLRMINGDLPTEAEKVELITELETTVLPVVESLQVEYFMDEPDCANLTYSRGDFVDGDPRLCGGSTNNPVAFDETARADHSRIRAALAESGTPIERAGGSFSDDGRMSIAWFSSTSGAPFATSWSLDYDPQGLLGAGTIGMVTRSPVAGATDWWFACCAD